MIIRCPNCGTSYKLDAARLAGPNPTLKCSRCRHTFPAPSAKKPPPPPPAEKPSPAADESLSLPFDDPNWKDEERPPPADLTVRDDAEDRFTLGAEEPEDEFTMPSAAAEPDLTAGAEDAIDEVPPPRRRRRAARPADRPPRRSHLGALFVFFAIVVAAYAAFARALLGSPALCDRLIGRLPLIGHMNDDRLLTRKVALSEVSGGYQRIKDGKEVFVISGKAMNTAPVALRGVQIAGKIFNGAGEERDEKVIYCGNVVSAKVLKDLTPRELSILQKLSPPQKFAIEPGDASTFVIVFMDPPRDAAEFTAQVIGAQRQA